MKIKYSVKPYSNITHKNLHRGEWVMCIKNLVMTATEEVEAFEGKLYSVQSWNKFIFEFKNESGNNHQIEYSTNEWFRKKYS